MNSIWGASAGNFFCFRDTRPVVVRALRQAMLKRLRAVKPVLKKSAMDKDAARQAAYARNLTTTAGVPQRRPAAPPGARAAAAAPADTEPVDDEGAF